MTDPTPTPPAEPAPDDTPVGTLTVIALLMLSILSMWGLVLLRALAGS